MSDQPVERRRLGEILVERGLVTEGGVRRALEEQARTGELIGRILLDRGWLSNEQLVEALSDQEASEQANFDLAHGLRARLSGEGEQDEADAAQTYFVRLHADGEPLHVAYTFFDAADLALETIGEHDPERLEIVRTRGDELENVWTYSRQPQAQLS